MPPLVVIVGETASGKSALALELAKRLDGEIICADSWTVYKGFDIGTAKPTAAERAEIPHFLLDVADPEKGFSAPQFQRLAVAAIDDISARGKLPIMVGGTGLYIDSVIFDYSFLPPSGTGERSELNSLPLARLLDIARDKHLPLDTIDSRNKRRVIRLIENDGKLPTRSELRANTLIFGVRRPRPDLKRRIERRIDKMVADGFADEVSRLGRQYGWDIEPMKAPGYRAFADFAQGKISLEVAKDKAVQNDLKLAKKQRTWFRRPIYKSSIHWLDDPSKMDYIVDLVTTKLSK